ncbi:hypothetical protein [Colwellia psychrerythraea]|uniref:Uncharacterized protein n=1 Tax=Colwellia psychrerythraea TaxID=28229 RepID=A0A099KKJ4_COLPS|nr:hypothetical protein [Colwellia psychrerythraea]KGJ90951.1 hypothetical protein GAB14E_0615 [Colwellia psychrerythraea]
MRSVIVLLVFLVSVANAETFSINTNIKKIRTVTEFNPEVKAREQVAFQVNAPLEGGCTWLYLTPEAKSAYSLLLASKIAGKEVGIQYSTTPSPWHTATCQVHFLDLD